MAVSHRPRRAGRTLRALALVPLQASLALVLGEGLLRLAGPVQLEHRMSLDTFGRELVVAMPGQLPATGLRPLGRGSTYGHPVRVNSLGFRGPEPPPREPGTARIVVLGRSVAFGWGVAETEAWPARLETFLREAGRPAQVLNLSVPAWTLADVFGAVLRYAPELRPDLVLLPVHPDDLIFYEALKANLTAAPPPPLGRARRALEAFLAAPAGERLFLKKLLGTVYARLQVALAERQAQFRQEAGPAGEGALLLVRALQVAAACCRSQEARLLVMDMIGEAKLAEWCRREGIAYALGRIDWDRTPRPAQIGSGDPHPNACGHRLLAAQVLPAVAAALADEGR